MNDDTAQVVADLKAARDELARRGRCRGDLVRNNGSVCAVGAICVAIDENFEAAYRRWDKAGLEEAVEIAGAWSKTTLSPRVRAVKAALREHLLPEFNDYLQGFNDHERTTDEDVLNLFDKTLASLGGLA